MGTSHQKPSRLAVTFLSCFLLSNFTGVRRYFLLFTFLTCEIFDFRSCFLHSRVCVFLVFLSRVCVGSKILHVKNANKSKNRLTSVKLESKKQEKKVVSQRGGQGWKGPIVPSDVATARRPVEAIFHNIFNISLRVIRRRNYS